MLEIVNLQSAGVSVYDPLETLVNVSYMEADCTLESQSHWPLQLTLVEFIGAMSFIRTDFPGAFARTTPDYYRRPTNRSSFP